MPLGLKEIEHCLCEYSKFCRVSKNTSAGAMRRYKSKQNYDFTEPCMECGGH